MNEISIGDSFGTTAIDHIGNRSHAISAFDSATLKRLAGWQACLLRKDLCPHALDFLENRPREFDLSLVMSV